MSVVAALAEFIGQTFLITQGKAFLISSYMRWMVFMLEDIWICEYKLFQCLSIKKGVLLKNNMFSYFRPFCYLAEKDWINCHLQSTQFQSMARSTPYIAHKR